MTEAEELWREAGWEFLRACFSGAPAGVLQELGRALLAMGGRLG